MILEFDKTKKLLTPWGITTYGDKVNLQLEFDLPACACFESINNITLNIYKKGEAGLADSLLLTTSDFNLADQTTWYGSIIFLGDELLEYINSVADTTAVLDGQFVFQVAGNKTINSQVFFIKVYGSPGPTPPEPTYPTTGEVQDMIDVGIERHNTDLDAHEELLSRYATIEYLNNLIGKVNNIETLTTETLAGHYTYDTDLNVFEFDIKNDGAIIRLYNIPDTITELNLKFTNVIDGRKIEIYLNKTSSLDINYFLGDDLVEVFQDADISSGEIILNFTTINSVVKFVNGTKI